MTARRPPIEPIPTVEREHPWLYVAYIAAFVAAVLLSFP